MEPAMIDILSALKNPLIIGALLDALLGDPLWLPHPIRLFGKLISAGEKKLNKGSHRILKGGVLVFVLVSLVAATLYALKVLLKDQPNILLAYESVLVFYGLANRGLVQEALKVERKLMGEGIVAARKQLSMIVGRETQKLTGSQVRTATLETLAENLSDGVVAPLFFYAVGGAPLMLAYKMANTLDSMIGYKNDKYILFGRVAARFDDVLNYLPARLTAYLMALLSLSLRGLKFIFRFGRKHASPNAGFPEAALAGILDCQFGGPNYYHGKRVDKPYIGQQSRELSHNDVLRTCRINWGVFVACTVLVFVGRLLLG